MNRSVKTHLLAVSCLLLFVAIPVNSQKLKLTWSKQFAQPVLWYVRTSPGILLVQVGKSLIAVDEADGRQLWMFPVVEPSGKSLGGLDAAADRGRNIVEVPGMGVLLLNRVKLPGDSDGRLIAVNLMTGKRLWDAPQVDDLMTAVPLYESGQAILVLRRLEKKAFVKEMIITGSVRLPMLLYPYRFEFERLDLVTGKPQWNAEYERTFMPGTATVKALGDHLFVYYGNQVLGCVDLTNGKVLWADGSKLFGTGSLALPLEMANGKLIYGSKNVQAIDPITQKADWGIYDLGKITGIFLHDGLAVALGEKSIAAVDTTSGTER